MTNITNTLHKSIYGYRRSEFMPIYEYGKLHNKKEFVYYKARKALTFVCDLYTVENE